MAIEIFRDPFAEQPYEHCCFCRKPTVFWHRPKDVACCEDCAAGHSTDEVPTKAEWWAKESELSPSFLRFA